MKDKTILPMALLPDKLSEEFLRVNSLRKELKDLAERLSGESDEKEKKRLEELLNDLDETLRRALVNFANNYSELLKVIWDGYRGTKEDVVELVTTGKYFTTKEILEILRRNYNTSFRAYKNTLSEFLEAAEAALRKLDEIRFAPLSFEEKLELISDLNTDLRDILSIEPILGLIKSRAKRRAAKAS